MPKVEKGEQSRKNFLKKGNRDKKTSRRKQKDSSDGDSEDSNKKKKARKPSSRKQSGRQINTQVRIQDDILMLYPDIENPPEGQPVKMNREATHTAPQVKISDTGLTVSNEKGYRMAKATHGVWEGHWYYEVKILSHSGNSRIGWSQISGDLQGPCGYDRFSYSYRDSPGALFHKSERQRGSAAFSGGYGNLYFNIRTRRCFRNRNKPPKNSAL